VLAHRRSLIAFIFAASLSPLACAVESGEASVEDHHDDGEGPIGVLSSPLVPSDTVATAVASNACATSTVKGLSIQLVQEIQCLRPNTFTAIDKTPGLALGGSVMPYMQTKAAQALVAAQKARGTTMSINSAMRTLPQQFLLYRWYQTGRCGIRLAAAPGTSNHEGAIAVDINDNAGWRTSMQGKGFRWLGAKDAVHYDFVGGGTVNLRGLSVKAFQRLWNRNNPNDRIAEDGDYGPATASRLAQSPIGGFVKGADCTEVAPDAGAGSGDEPGLTTEVPIVPDATEGEAEGDGDAPTTTSTVASEPLDGPAPEATGCAVAHDSPASPSSKATFAIGLAAALVLAARRRRDAVSPAPRLP
jgi:MYXO-CTERM domain-containing protein